MPLTAKTTVRRRLERSVAPGIQWMAQGEIDYLTHTGLAREDSERIVIAMHNSFRACTADKDEYMPMSVDQDVVNYMENARQEAGLTWFKSNLSD